MLKNDNGSITLEAAMILPFFLLFAVFLATIIRIGVLEIAMEETVSHTTEIAATHAYVATFINEGPREAVDKRIKNFTENQVPVAEVEKRLNLSLRESDFIPGDMEYLEDITKSKLEPVVRDKFNSILGSSMFNASELQIEELELPANNNGGKDSIISITLTYEMKAVVPFVNKDIVIKNQGAERVWTGAY
ncbi:hypothetical protein ACFFGV_20820 [Pontibacillus salicampi]|uniref:Pilus assembly protein n=1 Tax=Pontibacillus salicampi TaxID=1449801 RepID=A0ABV6LUN9_9BACI